MHISELFLGLNCRGISQGSCCIILFKIEFLLWTRALEQRKAPSDFMGTEMSFHQSRTPGPGASLTRLNSPWVQRSLKRARMGGKREEEAKDGAADGAKGGSRIMTSLGTNVLNFYFKKYSRAAFALYLLLWWGGRSWSWQNKSCKGDFSMVKKKKKRQQAGFMAGYGNLQLGWEKTLPKFSKISYWVRKMGILKGITWLSESHKAASSLSLVKVKGRFFSL